MQILWAICYPSKFPLNPTTENLKDPNHLEEFLSSLTQDRKMCRHLLPALVEHQGRADLCWQARLDLARGTWQVTVVLGLTFLDMYLHTNYNFK